MLSQQKHSVDNEKQGISERALARVSSSNDIDRAIEDLIAEGNRQLASVKRASLSSAEIAKAITSAVPRRSVSLAYRINLTLVATAMAILPIMYLALVVSVGCGVVFYTWKIMPDLLRQLPIGRIVVLYFLAIVSPTVVGSILVIFLVKPLFFRISDDVRRRSLSRKGEPLLFQLVDEICKATGAPVPVRIDVNYQVNASASAERGLISILRRRLVLTIGVPLISGLSTKQLAGVLAHEFGHFNQGFGMGTTYVITKVNWWFTRVVFQRDTLDEALESAIQNLDWKVGMLLQLAHLCVLASRGVLWCFMTAGHIISASLLRQMEYDADWFEYGLVGRSSFVETSKELPILAAVYGATHDSLFQFYTRGKLADNMILMGERYRQQVPISLVKATLDAVTQESSNWLSTHPTTMERIASANSSEQTGCFQLDRPARELVVHYEALCKNVTWDFYRDRLGTLIPQEVLTPTDKLMQWNKL